MSKKQIEIAYKFFQKDDNIEFGILFGSYAQKRTTNLSDIDLGIFSNKYLNIFEIGNYVINLEQIFKRKVDLVILNDLYKKKPQLCFEIVANGKLIFYKNKDRYYEFKKNTFLYFFDTYNLRTQINQSFRNRLNSGKFGERNYVG